MPVAPENTWIIAHRGASRERVENTLDAFEAAIEAGVDGIELDVQCTADGALLVYHDDRLPDPERTFLRDADLAYTRELLLAQGVRAPLLADVLTALAGRTFLDIELKKSANATATAELCTRLLPDGSYHLKSFYDFHLHILREAFPEIPRGLLVFVPGPEYDEAFVHASFHPEGRIEAAGAAMIHPEPGLLGDDFLGRMAELELPVWLWTLDDTAALLEAMRAPEVHAVITNFPRRALYLRERLAREEV